MPSLPLVLYVGVRPQELPHFQVGMTLGVILVLASL